VGGVVAGLAARVEAVGEEVVEAVKKLLEVCVAVRQNVPAITGRQSRQVMLHGSNLIEQPQRIERRQDRAQAVFHRTFHITARERARTGRFRHVVALGDARPDAALLSQLEGRLKEVNEESGCGIQTRQRFARTETFESPIADQPPYDGAILLLDPCLVVLPIRP
jgi:hypothetical protein